MNMSTTRRALLIGSAASVAATTTFPALAKLEPYPGALSTAARKYLRQARIARRSWRRYVTTPSDGLAELATAAIHGRDNALRRLAAARSTTAEEMAHKLAALQVVRLGCGPDRPGDEADVRLLLASCHRDARAIFGSSEPVTTR